MFDNVHSLLSLTRRPRQPGDPLVAPPTQYSRLIKVLATIAIVNFALFCMAAAYLGGDALNGYAADGHYFLKWKGHITEVSRQVFYYSYWHALITIALHAIAIGAWLLKKARSS